MYGMINASLHKLIKERYGINIWENIREQIGFSEKVFKDLKPYDDSITLEIFKALSENTNRSVDELLQEFGEFWMSFAQRSNYAGILESFALTPWELIESLDALHHRLGLVFDKLRPPSFWVIEKDTHSVLLGYRSDRGPGLEFFVVGLLKGVFAMFNAKCEVEILTPLEDETARFYVRQ